MFMHRTCGRHAPAVSLGILTAIALTLTAQAAPTPDPFVLVAYSNRTGGAPLANGDYDGAAQAVQQSANSALADPQALETFERSKLNWSELPNPPHCVLLDWHRRLIRLRQAEPALHDGRLEGVKTHFDELARWFAMEREGITVACNLADQSQDIPLRTGQHLIVLASELGVKVLNGRVNLPPESVSILKLE